MVGASTGATPRTRNSRESIVAAARPSNRSRTIARATTAPAAVPTPWSTRSAPRTARFGATTHEQRGQDVQRPVPASSGRRRPSASETGPSTSWPSARPIRVPVRVSWTAADVVSRSRVMVGSAGRYMSMVRGPRATKPPEDQRGARDAGRARAVRRCGGRGPFLEGCHGSPVWLGGCRGRRRWLEPLLRRATRRRRPSAFRCHGVFFRRISAVDGRAAAPAVAGRRTAPHHRPAP